MSSEKLRSTETFVLCVLLWAPPAAPDTIPTANTVLERSIRAMGGFEKFARLREAWMTSVVVHADGRSTGAGYTQHVRLPYAMRLTRDGANAFELDGLRGQQETNGNTPTPADATTVAMLRGRLWREWWVAYANFAWHGIGEVWISLQEPVIDGGRRYHSLRFVVRDAGEYLLYIDDETSRPVRREYRDGESHVVESFEDVVDIEGIHFPTRVTQYRDGRVESIQHYDSVAFEFDSAPLTLERRLDAIIRTSIAEKQIPGLVAMVQRGDDMIFARAYGKSSIEHDIPVTLNTIFPLASVSKIFAGTLAMRLVDDGQLDLDASIRDYLDDVPAQHADVATRHLLNHSHGLADALSDNPGRGMPISDAEKGTRESRLAWSFGQAPIFEPGTDWAYSIGGYEILQAILEKASGLDYESLARREIFAPLGLNSARFGGSDRIIPGRAAMDYVWVENKLTYNYLNYPADIFTSAGLNASAGDVMRFYRGVATGELLEPESRATMWREVVLGDGTPTSYGLGWGSFRSDSDGRWSVGHSGGGSSWTRYFPDYDLTIIVLSNLNGAREDRLVYDLATAVLQSK